MLTRSNLFLVCLSAGLTIALLLSIRSCRKNAQSFADINSYQKSLTDSIRHLPNNVVSKPVIYITPESFQQVIDQRDDLKKQVALMKVKPKQIQNITTVVNTITIVDTIVKHDTIAGVPVNHDSLVFRTESDSENIVTAQKSFLFKKSEYNMYIHHSNLHINTTGMESITVRDNKKWWQTGAVKTIVAFVGGIFIAHTILK